MNIFLSQDHYIQTPTLEKCSLTYTLTYKTQTLIDVYFLGFGLTTKMLYGSETPPGPAGHSRNCHAGEGWGHSGCISWHQYRTSLTPGQASFVLDPVTGAGTSLKQAGGPRRGRGKRGFQGEQDRLNRCSLDAWDLRCWPFSGGAALWWVVTFGWSVEKGTEEVRGRTYL